MLRKCIAIFTVAAFVLIAALPLYGMLLPGTEQSVENENRAAAEFPADASLAELPAAYEAYFNDHFAFRGELVGLYNNFEYLLRGSYDRVVYGSDGWLFYTQNGIREDIQRINPYSQEELDAICAAQRQTVQELADMGSAYYLLFCPDKQTVYPEYLPEDLPIGDGPSRLDTIVSALAENTDVTVVDARPAVLAAKEEHQVFLKTDTHWNGYGAFAAYDLLAARLEAEVPGFRRLLTEDCAFTESEEQPGGDLAGMLGRADELTEAQVDCSPKHASAVRVAELPFREPSADPNRNTRIFENPEIPDGPTCVLFQDSYGNHLLPMLREGFSRLVVVWSTGVVEDVIRVEQPDVVIMEYVERLSGGARNGILRAEE